MNPVSDWRRRVSENIRTVYRGPESPVDLLLTAVLAGGHVLLEDIPGVGKTLLAQALAQSLGGTFSRVQGTPDLTPADLLGFSVYNPADGRFTFRRGPVESSLLLFDEVNRASPRTQSALLQAMGEGSLTRDGQVIALPDPFLVVATQNPIEFEGTFPLPEAQRDRFLFTFSLGYPHRDDEERIMRELPLGRPPRLEAVSSLEETRGFKDHCAQVWVDPKVSAYILDLAEATRRDTSLRLGLSPRGTQALFQACRALALVRDRLFVLPDDVKELFLPVGRGRVLIKPAALARGLTAIDILSEILDRLPTPALKDGGRS